MGGIFTGRYARMSFVDTMSIVLKKVLPQLQVHAVKANDLRGPWGMECLNGRANNKKERGELVLEEG